MSDTGPRPNQVKAADEIFRHFTSKEAHVVLCAQMQQGKTGAAIEVIRRCLALGGGRKEIIVISCVNDHALTVQWEERINKAGLSLDRTKKGYRPNTVRVLYPGILKHHPIIPDVTHRLIVLDECHIGQGKNGMIAKFLKECGVMHWDSRPKPDPNSTTSNYVLRVSATPWMEHVAMKKMDWIRTVYLDAPENYTGIEKLMNTPGRIKPIKKVIYDGKATPWIREVARDHALKTIKRHQRGEKRPHRHFIIRMTRDERIEAVKDAIVEEIKQVYTENKMFNWDVNANSYGTRPGDETIKDLTEGIQDIPLETITDVYVVRGALRQGHTIEETRHIGTWIDTFKHGTANDSTVQSIGRLCGIDRVYDDDLVIYCDSREFSTIIDFFDNPHDLSNIPDGNNTKQGYTKGAVKQYDVRVFSTKQEVKDYMSSNHSDVAISFSVCSENRTDLHSSDIAHVISVKNYGHRQSDKKWRAFHLDGPSQNFPESWKELMENDPDLIGKYVLPIPLPERITEPNRVAKEDPMDVVKKNKILDRSTLPESEEEYNFQPIQDSLGV